MMDVFCGLHLFVQFVVLDLLAILVDRALQGTLANRVCLECQFSLEDLEGLVGPLFLPLRACPPLQEHLESQGDRSHQQLQLPLLAQVGQQFLAVLEVPEVHFLQEHPFHQEVL